LFVFIFEVIGIGLIFFVCGRWDTGDYSFINFGGFFVIDGSVGGGLCWFFVHECNC